MGWALNFNWTLRQWIFKLINNHRKHRLKLNKRSLRSYKRRLQSRHACCSINQSLLWKDQQARNDQPLEYVNGCWPSYHLQCSWKNSPRHNLRHCLWTCRAQELRWNERMQRSWTNFWICKKRYNIMEWKWRWMSWFKMVARRTWSH